MAINFSPGVSRTLDPKDTQYQMVVWQASKPPLDSELNLVAQVANDQTQKQTKTQMPSGFLIDPTLSSKDYLTSSLWSNLFLFGSPKDPYETNEGTEAQPVVWAVVNGWFIPVAGTDVATNGDVRNFIRLYPPPTTGDRIDFVFLEVWQTLVNPNPSTVNKPSASTVWKYGNVQYGGINLSDDLEDANIGIETTKRVQIQYRIRVHGNGTGIGAGVALDAYPEGLDDPLILGQGTAASPVGGFTFANMRATLGDPSLWRAGDGDSSNDLGTIDGYVYAIPICAVFRRNTNPYVGINLSGDPNHNGAFNRNPGAYLLPDPRDASRMLLEATLTSFLDPTDGVGAPAVVSVTNLNGSGFEDSALTLANTFIKIDDEIIGISAVDAINGNITIPAGGRGRYATAIVGHQAGAALWFFTTHPNGFYADEISFQDILDLRHAINSGDWDYTRLLTSSVASLLRGELRSAWKTAGPGGSQGVSLHEVDVLHADGLASIPNQTEGLDGPDGIRTIWSDAVVIQSDVTVLLDNEAVTVNNGVGLTTGDQFDTNVSWDVGADFKPVGFLNHGNDPQYDDTFTNGSSIFFFLGGSDGTEGARGTFRDGNTRAVRFVTPKEYWKSQNQTQADGNQFPVWLRFLQALPLEPKPTHTEGAATFPGPFYALERSNFEQPFLVLGGLLHPSLKVAGVNTSNFSVLPNANPPPALIYYIDIGLNFDTLGTFYSLDSYGDFESNPDSITIPLLKGSRTLYDMLTNRGQDKTGASSELYIVVYGDPDSHQNNGAFKVIGAGTVGYTTKSAANATSLALEPLSADFDLGDPDFGNTGNQVTIEFRSQYTLPNEDASFAARTADMIIVLTDVAGSGRGTPWAQVDPIWDFPIIAESPYDAVKQKLLVSTTLLYFPGRGGSARIADTIDTFGIKATSSNTYLSQNPALIDVGFSAVAGTPDDEITFSSAHVQTWNRLPQNGLYAPNAPTYGGNLVGFTEIDRESQVFFDSGSKTIVFRPFRNREMTIQTHSYTDPSYGFIGTNSLIGDTYNYANAPAINKDGLNLFTGTVGTGKQMGFAVPREFMPRFGRQDIPYYNDVGTFLPGVNHLFTDSADLTASVFNIVGGADNISAGNEVTVMHFITDDTNYGDNSTFVGIANNAPYLYARKTTAISIGDPNGVAILQRLGQIRSADFGNGLRGIQFPPYYGMARVIGVYETTDFTAKGGRSVTLDRYTVDADPATNLLREDARKQTLYILQGGAKDITLHDGDHTYIIPENAIDISRIPTYTPGDDFNDFQYVVVCTVFGFSRDWINGNNYVLVRKHNGQGQLLSDGTDVELEGIEMTIPCPASSNDRVFQAYERTVYQGDPYGTRNGSTRNMSDYTTRYGQISIANQYELKTPIQQFDANGDLIPQIPNARPFEILSSLDFFTTLGTGKIGGLLSPGTVLDIGYTDQAGTNRLPENASAEQWPINTRAFTEGQKENTSRARANIALLDNNALYNANLHGDAFFVDLINYDGVKRRIYFIASDQTTLYNLVIGNPNFVPVENIVDIDRTGEQILHTVRTTAANFGTVSPISSGMYSSEVSQLITVPFSSPTIVGDPSVIITTDSSYTSAYGSVIFTGRLSSSILSVRAHYTVSLEAFETTQTSGADATTRNVRQYTYDFGNITAQSTLTTNITWTGADPAKVSAVLVIDTGTVAVPNSGPEPGLVYDGYVSALNTVTIRATNITGAPINPDDRTFNVSVLQDVDPTVWQISLASVNFTASIIWNTGNPNVTMQNFINAVNIELFNNEIPHNVFIQALPYPKPEVELQAMVPGSLGNRDQVRIGKYDWAIYGSLVNVPELENVFTLSRPSMVERLSMRQGAHLTSLFFSGGQDLFINAGNGTNQISNIGVTERLPLGILLQDSDFICENPFRDTASALQTNPSLLALSQTILPLTNSGLEFTRFFGSPGEIIAMSDGAINTYIAFTDAVPGGTKKFRLYRGGGSAFVAGDTLPGGPIDWILPAWSESMHPVLKGGVLICRALLVRNYYEEAFATPNTTTHGDEIQLIILTYGILGNQAITENGLNLQGILSPTGYGEGYAATDRYRLNGRPMVKTYNRSVSDPDAILLAPYTETR